MKKTSLTLFGFAFLLMFIVSCNTTQKKDSTSTKAKNVILMIGDGMSVPQICFAMEHSEKQLAFEKFTYTGLVKTRSKNAKITDSAASGTAIATGQKTNNGMIGMNSDSIPIPSILETLKGCGKNTGIVVSCSVTHATPAAFIAKNCSRNNNEAIAVDFASTDKLDVLIGGGRKYFSDRKDSLNLIEKMKENGWKLYDSLKQVEIEDSKTAVLLSKGHPKTALEGRGDLLPDGVTTALSLLNKAENGFFLMVEGSQIDWAGHNNDTEYLKAEMEDFNKTIEIVLDFARENPETLVIVTADHETGGLTLVPDSTNAYNSIEYKFATTNHSALMVPIFAIGPGAEQFTGIMDNTEIYNKICQVIQGKCIDEK